MHKKIPNNNIGFITEHVKEGDIITPRRLTDYDGYKITFGKKYIVIKSYASFICINDDTNNSRYIIFDMFNTLLTHRTENINDILQ